MIKRRAAMAAGAALILSIASSAVAQTPKNVVGTWRPVSATLEVNGKKSLPYEPDPQGKLTFTSDLHLVEFLHDPRIPRFKSDTRGEGTNKENRAAMAGMLALYGRVHRRCRGQLQRQHGIRFILPQLDRRCSDVEGADYGGRWQPDDRALPAPGRGKCDDRLGKAMIGNLDSGRNAKDHDGPHEECGNLWGPARGFMLSTDGLNDRNEGAKRKVGSFG